MGKLPYAFVFFTSLSTDTDSRYHISLFIWHFDAKSKIPIYIYIYIYCGTHDRNTPESLGECFERNAEGMLKNMAIHELALLVSFYDVTVENIASVTADKEFSSMQTLPGPSGKEFTDFDKIKFTIKTKTGKEVSVAADRCGGTDSYATVTNANGEEVFRYWMPDDEDKATVQKLQAKYPTAMPYFFTQDPDYVTVKERVAKHTVTGEEAVGVATIGVAVETLRVAEYLTPTLMEQLK
jgi:hypothetical protein